MENDFELLRKAARQAYGILWRKDFFPSDDLCHDARLKLKSALSRKDMKEGIAETENDYPLG